MNARLSARSAARYARFQFAFDMMAKHIDHLLCLHHDDADRFQQLGVPASKVSVTGSVKFDIKIESHTLVQANQLRQQLGAERPIWVAASTHKGEDEQVLTAFEQVRQQHPNSLLILVPRHPERFDHVAQLCQQQGFNCLRRTSAQQPNSETDIYLADTMGEMLIMMGAADVTFMAGSLIGDRVGGHNMLEPAALGKPILTGPSYFNFADITQQLEAAGALEVCQDANALGAKLSVLLGDTPKQTAMGNAAQQVVKQNQGAVTKTLDTLTQLLAG